MTIQCPDCGRLFDDAQRNTICPHPGLAAAGPVYSTAHPGRSFASLRDLEQAKVIDKPLAEIKPTRGISLQPLQPGARLLRDGVEYEVQWADQTISGVGIFAGYLFGLLPVMDDARVIGRRH